MNIKIESRAEYEYCIQRGYQPLVDPWFDLEINLRVSIQKEIFGHTYLGFKNIPQANQRFYYWVWKHKPHYCEESLRPLHNYSAEFISHIFTKGSHPEMAHDPRNVNILFTTFHNMWEDDTKQKKLSIYRKNQTTMRTLILEYNQLKKSKQWNL